MKLRIVIEVGFWISVVLLIVFLSEFKQMVGWLATATVFALAGTYLDIRARRRIR